MDQSEIEALVPGAREVVELYGYWPSFHDAEVVCLELNRLGRSRIQVHTFEMTDEVDGRGYYVIEKHALVSFLLESVSTLQLDGFNDQNVISGLGLKKTAIGFELLLGGCYGIEGRIACAQLSIEMKPGIPEQSIYGESARA
jgi:Immunity protein 50